MGRSENYKRRAERFATSLSDVYSNYARVFRRDVEGSDGWYEAACDWVKQSYEAGEAVFFPRQLWLELTGHLPTKQTAQQWRTIGANGIRLPCVKLPANKNAGVKQVHYYTTASAFALWLFLRGPESLHNALAQQKEAVARRYASMTADEIAAEVASQFDETDTERRSEAHPRGARMHSPYRRTKGDQ